MVHVNQLLLAHNVLYLISSIHNLKNVNHVLQLLANNVYNATKMFAVNAYQVTISLMVNALHVLKTANNVIKKDIVLNA